MRILSMTATFGKLTGDTLTLKPNLNVFNAPNEWGKSTWCAFMTAMLYGIDTKERTTTTSLADKEHYAPWSGAPMSGRMDLSWRGRNITIERTTKGRVPMGEFQAYETETGLPVKELTATNCGEILLGVEKSVFTKSGFIRLADMPVTADEALRRRLNALVTTGDESGTGDILAEKLNTLRNKCRHNKTGYLPQCENQRDQILGKLDQHQALQNQLDQIQQQQEQLSVDIDALRNHQLALDYEDARQGAQRLEQAKIVLENARQNLETATARCQALPSKDYAEMQLQQLQHLQSQKIAISSEVTPTIAPPPVAPAIFAKLTAEEAVQKAKADKKEYDALASNTTSLFSIFAGVFALAGIALVFLFWIASIPCFLAAATLLLTVGKQEKDREKKRQNIAVFYDGLQPEQWVTTAQSYYDTSRKYVAETAAVQAIEDSLASRKQSLENSIHTLTQGLSLEETIEKWRGVIKEHNALSDLEKILFQADERVADLTAAIKTAEPPKVPDTLSDSREETATKLQKLRFQQQQLQLQAGQCMGQKESLGAESLLKQQLDTVLKRISVLEDTYTALTIAMEALTDATNALQRKFAPRISKRAQELFQKLTGGRYDRLQLTRDLGLNTAAEGEAALQAARWRSDGTVDQLYLALRLAVAEELTPEAPLILDDAFVRFDDTRLMSAMEIMREEAQRKQVILFTCHNREKE